jgi:hypothetical protein
LSLFSDAPEKVRIEIERDGAAKMAALFAGDAGKFSFSPLIFVLDLGFFWGF